MHDLCPTEAEELFGGETGETAALLVDKSEAALGVGGPDHDRRGIGGIPKALLAFPEQGLGAQPGLGHIEESADGPANTPFRIAEWAGVTPQNDFAAARQANFQLRIPDLRPPGGRLEGQVVNRNLDAVSEERIWRIAAPGRQCGVRTRFKLEHGVAHTVQGDDAALRIVSCKQGDRSDLHDRLHLFDAPAELLFEALTVTDIPGGPDQPDWPLIR